MAQLKIPNKELVYEDYKNIYSAFNDFKKIISVLPMDSFSSANQAKLLDALNKLKETSSKYIQAFEDNEYLYDMFEKGGESVGFCNKTGYDEFKLYKMLKFFKEVNDFDLKDFILKRDN